MRPALLIVMSACAALSVEMPTEQEVQRSLEDSRARVGDGEPTLLAACSFGFAACGSAAKANACADDLRKRYPSTPVLKLLTPGSLSMPCADCYGLPMGCQRCEGKGELVTMVGSKPVRCVVCAGSGIVKAGCKTCKDTNRDPLSKEACARLFWCITADEHLGIVLESKAYIETLALAVDCARFRAGHAFRIRGLVYQSLPEGQIVRLEELTDSVGQSQDNSLVFISTAAGLSSNTRFCRFAFRDGTYSHVAKYGDLMTIDRYLLSPWYGLLKAQPVMEHETVMGVPRSVYDQIKNRAEHDWPNDYGMQKFRITQELNNYKALKAMP